MNTLQETYNKEIRPELKKHLGIANIMAVPRLKKIVINCGMGEALTDKKVIEKMSAQIAIMVGQKPQITKAKKAIAAFKLRENDIIGLKVTLRNKQMYDFVTKLVRIALPRVRDFRGIPLHGFDGQGNYTMGIKEQTIFPEVDYAMVDKIRGFEITFVTSAKDNEGAQKLIELLGLPFEKKEKN